MKYNKYSVYFEGAGEEIVFADCMSHAVILGIVERIKKGLHIKAFSVKDWDDNKTHLLNRQCSITINWEEEHYDALSKSSTGSLAKDLAGHSLETN